MPRGKAPPLSEFAQGADDARRLDRPAKVAPHQVQGLQYVATYRGVEFEAHFGLGATVVLLVPPEHQRLIRRKDTVEVRDSPSGHWVLMPQLATECIVVRQWRAKWHGEPVDITQAVDPTSNLVQIGHERSPAFAGRWGLDGDQYSGWYGMVAFDELTDVHLDEHELPRRG